MRHVDKTGGPGHEPLPHLSGAIVKVAITGVTGFLGSHLAETFHRRGVDVIGVARRPERAEGMESERLTLRRADLADRQALAAAFEGADAVIANAALAPGWVKHDDRDFIQANIVGTDNTLRAAHDAGVRRIVLVSSVAVYRTRLRSPMDEATPQVDPEHPRFELSQFTTDARYARTKAASERLAWRLQDELELKITAVRPGPIYGPRDHKVTARYGRWNDRRLAVAPTARIPHVHALDVADAIAACLETPRSVGRAYNLGGTAESIYHVLRTWRRIAGGGARLIPLPTPVGVRFDDRRAQRELGFAPRPLDQGLVDCVAWYRQLVTSSPKSGSASAG